VASGGHLRWAFAPTWCHPSRLEAFTLARWPRGNDLISIALLELGRTLLEGWVWMRKLTQRRVVGRQVCPLGIHNLKGLRKIRIRGVLCLRLRLLRTRVLGFNDCCLVFRRRFSGLLEGQFSDLFLLFVSFNPSLCATLFLSFVGHRPRGCKNLSFLWCQWSNPEVSWMIGCCEFTPHVVAFTGFLLAIYSGEGL